MVGKILHYIKSARFFTRPKCNHLYLNKAGANYRENPVEMCIFCGDERSATPVVATMCDHQTKPSSTVARVFEMGVACPLCGETK